MKFALCNSSTRVKDTAAFAIIGLACMQAYNAKGGLCEQWGMSQFETAAFGPGETVPADYLVMQVTDTGDVPDALGWHDEVAGRACATIPLSPILDNGGRVFDGGTAGVSVSSVIAHELVEMLGDDRINKWAAMNDGLFLAWELCDPVQNDSFVVTLPTGEHIMLSNAVLSEYFDYTMTGSVPFDLMNKLTGPFTMSSGGYQSIYDPSTKQIDTVFGEKMPQWLREYKKRKGSRTSRMTPVTL